jgi:hypothetical protein
MKTTHVGIVLFVCSAVLSCSWVIRAQGTLVYDQQSTNLVEGAIALNRTPFGQSFTPTLDSIGFVDFQLHTGTFPSTVEVNLRSDSIMGAILGTSTSVTVPSNSTGSSTYEFLFSSPVSLTPGTKYYFEPVVVSGSNSLLNISFVQYAGGDAIYDGVTLTDRDFWFREGIVVPEPSLSALFAVGCCITFSRRCRQSSKKG